MAHDGFLGGFHGFSWPFAHGAVPAPFDAMQLQQVVMGSGGGWEHGGNARALDSALSSLVSSPASLAAAVNGGSHEAVLMDELASRFGGVCGDLGGAVPSPSSSRYASCYSTPVSSPSKPVVPVLPVDAVLAERAARVSCLTSAGGLGGAKLSRVASSQSLLAEPAALLAAVAPGGVYPPGSDGSSSNGHCRKRKASGGKAKGKDAVTTAIAKSPETETRSKKCKLSMAAAENDELIKAVGGEAAEQGGDGMGKETAAEPPKDYIHVRARRGQATDSHSLAERVRREKISERMKLLQDLVPGCSKVTGKAVMLDEIINYVQSLQRQVEFLSMKLATVNPRLDFDVDSLIPKDAVPPQANPPAVAPAPPALPLPPAAAAGYSLEGSSSVFCYASSHSQGTAMQSAVTNAEGLEMPPSFVSHGVRGSASLDGFQSANSQVVSLWEDDLQSVVQMGFRGNT